MARARTERRRLEREARKLAEDRAKLARLERGGIPERPIEVTSASLVEVHAKSAPCAICGGRVRVDDHTAPRAGLREAHVTCVECGTRRSIWFRIVPPLGN